MSTGRKSTANSQRSGVAHLPSLLAGDGVRIASLDVRPGSAIRQDGRDEQESLWKRKSIATFRTRFRRLSTPSAGSSIRTLRKFPTDGRRCSKMKHGIPQLGPSSAINVPRRANHSLSADAELRDRRFQRTPSRHPRRRVFPNSTRGRLKSAGFHPQRCERFHRRRIPVCDDRECHAITAGLGDAILFCTCGRLVRLGAGYGLQPVKHGMSRIESGNRFAIGIPFHEFR